MIESNEECTEEGEVFEYQEDPEMFSKNLGVVSTPLKCFLITIVLGVPGGGRPGGGVKNLGVPGGGRPGTSQLGQAI
jgi:hypothetical protein